MASTLARDELQLLSAAAVALRSRKKKREEYGLRTALASEQR